MEVFMPGSVRERDRVMTLTAEQLRRRLEIKKKRLEAHLGTLVGQEPRRWNIRVIWEEFLLIWDDVEMLVERVQRIQNGNGQEITPG
jgi:hypothetical protein